jgi:nitrile hydratase subunit beta
MNGIHDMGGMQDTGPIESEKNEPVFHSPWEGRVIAMTRAVQATGELKLGLRPPMETIPPAQYLEMSYWERWLKSLIERIVTAGLVTPAEIESGRPAEGTAKAVPALSAAQASTYLLRAAPGSRDIPIPARFQEGARVRARNINPVTHTRLPRYARGKTGTIARVNGVFPLFDTAAYSLPDKPQHSYSVRFSARELWGDQTAPQDAVYIDMWDDYLEPA